jgi:hypothetical protein
MQSHLDAKFTEFQELPHRAVIVVSDGYKGTRSYSSDSESSPERREVFPLLLIFVDRVSVTRSNKRSG